MSRGIYYFVVVSLVTVFKEINRFNLGAKAQLLSSFLYADEQSEDTFLWDVSGFVEMFELKRWNELEQYFSPTTIVGFGGESGIKGVQHIVQEEENNRCFNNIVFALKLGCRYIERGENMSCVSPPQSANKDIIYLGARAKFSFNFDKKKMVVDYFICGGD